MKIAFFYLLTFLMPFLLRGQNAPKVRMYGDGNTSIKINDSANNLNNAEKRTWLENSALAFSENGEELFFRHPTDKYYQVWNVTTKNKLSEITFSEAANTQIGREMIATFPNVIYLADANANSKIWLSPDLSVSFDNRNKFKISGGQNQLDKSFTLDLRNNIPNSPYTEYAFYNRSLKKAEMVNTRYKLYLNKASNKLFIVAFADQKLKNGKEYIWFPYNGVFSFDLANNTLKVLAENVFSGDNNFPDKWFFFSNNLVHNYINNGQSYFRRFNLASITQQDLEYATTTRGRAGIDDAWKNPFVGIDLQENLYLVEPTNQHLQIFYFDKAIVAKGTLVSILNSTNKLNEVILDKNYWVYSNGLPYTQIENVLAVSPSGKYFAYLSLNNRTTVGNYASIMLYNVDEKERVYTLNDQTKYQPYIAKGYVTDQESEALALTWQKQSDANTITKKNQDDAIASIKKKQDEAAKLERQTLYKPQLDTLKAKITATENKIAVIRKADLDYFNAKDYKSVLVRNKWSVEIIYESTKNLPRSSYFYANEKVQFSNSISGVYAIVNENLKFPASKKTDDDLYLAGETDYNDPNVEGVKKGAQYIQSNCRADLIDWKANEFRTKSSTYIFCQTKGIEILDNGGRFKQFGNKFLGILLNAKFTIWNSKEDNDFYINVIGAGGEEFTLESEKSQQEMILGGNLFRLKEELAKLETKIETGN